MAQMLMKGETWKDALKLVRGKARFTYPIYVEVKADEIRCRVLYVIDRNLSAGDVVRIEYRSFSEKPLYNMEHFDQHFLEVFRDLPGCTELDVGIEVNGNFNDSYRWTQSSSGIPTAKLDKKTGKISPALNVSMVKVIVFDLPEDTGEFQERMPRIDRAARYLRHSGLKAVRPIGHWAENEAQVLAIYNHYREAGEEGAMGKTRDHLYQRRRTFDWMKIKPSEDFDGRVTGFNEAVSDAGEPLGRVGSINVTCADGSSASPSGIPHGLGRELWENQHKYIGQWVEFYCMERDRKGGYRHPIYNRFREDKA
jgi:hypothetical protein